MHQVRAFHGRDITPSDALRADRQLGDFMASIRTSVTEPNDTRQVNSQIHFNMANDQAVNPEVIRVQDRFLNVDLKGLQLGQSNIHKDRSTTVTEDIQPALLWAQEKASELGLMGLNCPFQLLFDTYYAVTDIRWIYHSRKR